MSAMYAIAGVTGQTGKAVAEMLAAKGQPIRIIVRDGKKGASWKERGAEVAEASLDDETALTRALRGTKGAYLLLPPDGSTIDFFGSRARMTDAIGRAAVQAGLPHLVLLSSIAAHVPSGHGPIGAPYQAERSFEKLGIATTFVRAAYFLENYGAALPAAKSDGVLPSFLPANFTHAVVTTTDIGRTAAQALLDGGRGRRVIELSGPTDPTPADIAAALAELMSRPVKVLEAPLDAVVPTFMSFGMSQHMSEIYREMYAGFIAGAITWEGKGERVRGSVGVNEGLRGMLSGAWEPGVTGRQA
jgi:NAD(P)H dehydrogenase (quinone)